LLDPSGREVPVSEVILAHFNAKDDPVMLSTIARDISAQKRAEQLRLATDQLVYFAHWITPEERPIRFDTRFFAAPCRGRRRPTTRRSSTSVVDAGEARGPERGDFCARPPRRTSRSSMALPRQPWARLEGRVVSTARPRW
jgi:hypothetical protein